MITAYHMSATSPVILMIGSLFIPTEQIAWGGTIMAKIQMRKRRGREYRVLGSTLGRKLRISLENVVFRRKCIIYLFFVCEPHMIMITSRPHSLCMTRSPV
ncbi:hypothetical protein EV421DRAFT_1808997 [Armillaria borealis]|uniref:Uncharacterized protein n=1 Tax=Armillaria borealis TaxID=47425 RepID=A0AA39MQE0_9AGAR|nr:hypothetical protein EV421DRAFT_1808997 [Armillaria borealis]